MTKITIQLLGVLLSLCLYNLVLADEVDYDSSFSVWTSNGYNIRYDRESNLLSVLNSYDEIVLEGTPRYTRMQTWGFDRPTNRMFVFEVFGTNSSAEFTILRYAGEENISRYTRSAKLMIDDNGRRSKGSVTELQDFIPERDRPRYNSFTAQTTLGGEIIYDHDSRSLVITDDRGNEIHRGLAYYRYTELSNFGPDPIELTHTFNFYDEITGASIRVVLGLNPEDGSIRTATITELIPGMLRRNRRIAEFFNIEFEEIPSPYGNPMSRNCEAQFTF